MFIITNFFIAVAFILKWGLKIYMWIIIARAVLSWVNPDPYNPIVRFINNITEPVLYQIREKLPDMRGIDISPIIVILGIWFLQKFIVASIYDLALML